MFAEISPETIGVVLVVLLLVFGSAKIPHLARSLGQAKSEFQKGLKPDGRLENDNGSDRS